MSKSFDGFQVRAADDPPSNLSVVLDTAVASWIETTDAGENNAAKQAADRLRSVTEQLLIFLNTFLMLHDSNRVSVIIASANTCDLVFPVMPNASDLPSDYDTGAEDDALEALSTSATLRVPADPSVAMHSLREAVVMGVKQSLQAQMSASLGAQRGQGANGVLSTAVAKALCLHNRARKLRAERLALRRGKDGTAVDAAEMDVPANSRILAIVAAVDAPQHYVSIMNCMFAAQKLNIPIDSCVFAKTDSTYLQQAAHLTQGVSMRIAQQGDTFLQTLQTIFLADRQTRDFVAMPAPDCVDFRASCMQTRKIIEDGYTCSVCLSTFDSSVAKGTAMCAVCHARFALPMRGKRRPPRPK